jgi:hypothetical protein
MYLYGRPANALDTKSMVGEFSIMMVRQRRDVKDLTSVLNALALSFVTSVRSNFDVRVACFLSSGTHPGVPSGNPIIGRTRLRADPSHSSGAHVSLQKASLCGWGRWEHCIASLLAHSYCRRWCRRS